MNNTTWKIREPLQTYCDVLICGRPIRNSVIGKNIKDKTKKELWKHQILKGTCQCGGKFELVNTADQNIETISKRMITNKRSIDTRHYIKNVHLLKVNAKTYSYPTVIKILAYVNRHVMIGTYE